jgi:ABC-type transporter Mla subunit MlaD
MSGVSIGFVKDIRLGPDGKSVVLTLCIRQQYSIHKDADFQIEQAGLLGDQYISIVPRDNKAPMIRPDEEVQTAPASDFKMMLRSAAGLIEKLDSAAVTLQTAVGRVDKVLLNDSNLLVVSRAITNFEGLSTRAGGTLDRLDALVATNAPAVNDAVTNLGEFTRQLKQLGADLNSVVATNRDEVARAMKNLGSATAGAHQLLDDLQAGKGLAGGLLRDDSMKRDLGVFMTNLTIVSSNLTVTSSNLNERGLWWMLWSHKSDVPRTNASASPYTGRNPFP